MVALKHPFPDSFFEEEDRLGFHVDRKRKEIWAVELDMLLELDRVCRKLNIPYYLDGGTLIGAVRDGRFIPWDDDIDVSMLRENYDRFIREAPAEFEAPLFLQTGYTEENYDRGHCQLRNSETCAIRPKEIGRVRFNQGMFLDIFVIDDVFPERLEDQFRKREKLWHFHQVWGHHDYHPNPVRWGVRWCRYLLYRCRYPKSAMFYERFERIFRAEKKSEYVDSLMFHTRADQVHMLRRCWLENTRLTSFEGHLFPIPEGFHEYLTEYYGDYMTPKNVSSLHNAGGQTIFDTERSYTEVLKEISRRRKTGVKK